MVLSQIFTSSVGSPTGFPTFLSSSLSYCPDSLGLEQGVELSIRVRPLSSTMCPLVGSAVHLRVLRDGAGDQGSGLTPKVFSGWGVLCSLNPSCFHSALSKSTRGNGSCLPALLCPLPVCLLTKLLPPALPREGGRACGISLGWQFESWCECAILSFAECLDSPYWMLACVCVCLRSARHSLMLTAH